MKAKKKPEEKKIKRITFIAWSSFQEIKLVEWKCRVDVKHDVMKDRLGNGDAFVPRADLELEWLKCQKHFGLYDREMVGAIFALPYKGVEGRIVWIEQVKTDASERSDLIGTLEKEAWDKAHAGGGNDPASHS